MGEKRGWSGENASRASLALPAIQEEFVREMARTGRPVVVLLSSGRPVDVRGIEPAADALVEIWQPGTEGGSAVAQLLSGKVNPSGRLAITFPVCAEQQPVYYNQRQAARPKSGRYQNLQHEPMYPFGYGLSYTTFEYGDPVLSSDRMADDDTITATVKVTNTGDYDGEEVVQLYLRDIKAQITRPVKELKGFRKIFLKKGESADVTFDITRSDLEYVLADGSVVSDPGEFELFIGGSSAGLRPIPFTAR